MKRLVVLLFGLLALSACETQIERPTYAELTFTHKEPIYLGVARIDIVKAYQPTSAAPHVEMEFPVSPLDTAARWAQDRLKAVGTSGTATVTITEASAVETELAQEGGLTGAFTTEQSERYDGTLAMAVEVFDPNGSNGNTFAEVKRSITVPEDASLNDRERTWYSLTEKLARDLDKRMSENIRNHLSLFVRPGS